MLWDSGDYVELEKLFDRTSEYCRDNETWRLNVAHVLYMRNKLPEATSFYEPVIRAYYDNVCSNHHLIVFLLARLHIVKGARLVIIVVVCRRL